MLEIHYDPRTMKLLTVQLLITRGSLRDYIFQASAEIPHIASSIYVFSLFISGHVNFKGGPFSIEIDRIIS